MEHVVTHCGVFFVVKMGRGWLEAIKAFPHAGKADDPAILKYLKDRGLL